MTINMNIKKEMNNKAKMKNNIIINKNNKIWFEQ
jgi:hypothetical protein